MMGMKGLSSKINMPDSSMNTASTPLWAMKIEIEAIIFK